MPFPQQAFVTEYTFEQWVQRFEVNEGLAQSLDERLGSE
jgi:hypothetical protein